MLFNDISTFKQFVGGAVNQSVEIDSIAPTIEDAFDLYIRPWLGDELADVLVANYNDNALTTADEALLPYVRKPLAKLTMYQYSRVGAIQFSESGMHRIETENVRSAYKYQEEEYALAMLENGYEAIEQMLKFLDKNEAAYPDWYQSDAYTRHNAYFLRYASELRQHYSKYITRYAFECLKPLVEEVECFAVEGTLPVGFYADLKAKYVSGSANPVEKTAIKLIQKIITEFAIFEGLQRHWLQFDGDRVIHKEHQNDDLRSQHGKADPKAMSLALRHHELMGNRLVSKLVKYILDHELDFPLAFCQDGYWQEEETTGSPTDWYEVVGAGTDSWAYALKGDNPRCFLTAADRAKISETGSCCAPCCPERNTSIHTEISTRPCASDRCYDPPGSGSNKKSSVFRL